MLGRAAAYYRRFLGLHAEQDVQTLKAKMALAAIDKALQPPPSSGQPDIGKTAGGAWIDLIRLVDPARHTYTGRWRRRGGTLSVASSPHARLVVPISPKGSYELEVAFTRSEGHEEFFSLPAGDGAIGFVMNGWERQTGVNDARKQWIPAQSTEIGRKYTVRLSRRSGSTTGRAMPTTCRPGGM